MKVFVTLLWKDILITARSPWELLAILVFSSLSAIPSALVSAESLGTASKIVLLFITVYASTQTYVRESRAGTMEVYHIYPVAPSLHFLAKLSYTWLILLSSLAFYTTTLILLDTPLASISYPIVECISLTIYLSATSSLASLISTYLKAETTLLIAVTAILATPALLSGGSPVTQIILGLAYTIVALMAAELLEEG